MPPDLRLAYFMAHEKYLARKKPEEIEAIRPRFPPAVAAEAPKPA